MKKLIEDVLINYFVPILLITVIPLVVIVSLFLIRLMWIDLVGSF